MNRILLTGAEGMIGSHLLPYLNEFGYDVVPFVGDITNSECWNYYRHQAWNGLIHLAALAGVRESFKDPQKYFFNNVEGTENAFEFARQAGVGKVLYASSSNAYEWWGNPYATTKMINEIQGRKLASIGMRFHTVWPGRDDMLYRKLERGDVTYINVNHYRDFIHVDDLIAAIKIIYDNFWHLYPTGRVRDIGTGHSTPVAEVARIMGFAGEYRAENPTGERVKTCADVEYLLQLGWTPTKNILNVQG